MGPQTSRRWRVLVLLSRPSADGVCCACFLVPPSAAFLPLREPLPCAVDSPDSGRDWGRDWGRNSVVTRVVTP